MKQQIERQEYCGWLRSIDGKLLTVAIARLQEILLECDQKGWGIPIVNEDGEYGSWMTVSREETDEEYNRRLILEQRAKAEEERKEKVMFDRLYEKYGEPEKPKYLPYEEWVRIARPVMEPIIGKIPTPSVVDIMLRDAYNEYKENCK